MLPNSRPSTSRMRYKARRRGGQGVGIPPWLTCPVALPSAATRGPPSRARGAPPLRRGRGAVSPVVLAESDAAEPRREPRGNQRAVRLARCAAAPPRWLAGTTDHDGPPRRALPRRGAGLRVAPPAGRPPARPPGRPPHRHRPPDTGEGGGVGGAPETAAPIETATLMTSRITVDGDPIMGDDSVSEQKSSTPIPLRLRDPGQIARNSATKTAGHHTTAVLQTDRGRCAAPACLCATSRFP